MCTVTLSEALSGVSKSVKLLDGRVLPITASYVTPETIKTIPGEGMLNRKRQAKGDLKIKFKIIFPDNLTLEKRNKICNIINN